MHTITIDPEGYVVLRFKDANERSAFLKNLIGRVAGHIFDEIRTGLNSPHLSFKLSDFPAPFDLPLPEPPQTALLERAIAHIEATTATRPDYFAKGMERYDDAWRIVNEWQRLTGKEHANPQ
jgi:hypothetical protein